MEAKTKLEEQLDDMMDPVKSFNAYYEGRMKRGEIPLEFAGSVSRKLMEEAYTAGGSAFMMGMLMKMAFRKKED
jgi:hypothetical protein